MRINSVIHPKSPLVYDDYVKIIKEFKTSGKVIDDRGRNLIKSFEIKGQTINVKSFKIPHLLNQFIYKFFRPSKAKRSFEYACILSDKKIGTPKPLAYFEFTTFFALKRSYYFSEQLDYDLTFRELMPVPKYPDFENILRQFTRFTFSLHEVGIFFKDHSPGNTLIVRYKDQYVFYLIDLNRMSFFELDLDARIKNFSKLTTDKEIIKIMSDEYAKLIHQPFEVVYAKMLEETQKFRSKYDRRATLKNKIRGTKKS